MRVILANPPSDSDDYNDIKPSEGYLYPPLWAIYLASYFKNRAPRTEMHILDGQILNMADILKAVRLIRPNVVGIGSMWINYNNALVIARQANKCGSRVVMGGHHATGLAREILLNRGVCSDDYCIDAVVQRDGEKAFYEYAAGVSLNRIKNLAFQDKRTGSIKLNQIESMNLDNFSFPSRDVVDVDNYFKLSPGSPKFSYKRMLSIHSKRGCAWRNISKGGCIFCSRMDKGLRVRSPSSVFSEIDYLTKKFSADFIWDTSDNFFDGDNWFEEFYDLYKDYEHKPAMRIYSRVNNISEKIVRKLNDLKIVQVSLGLESGYQRSLTYMRKGTTVNTNKKAVKLLRGAGISVVGNFVLGAPNEDRKSLKASIDFIHQLNELNMDILWVYILEPLPNSLSFYLLKEKTGDKYKNKDLFDKYELISDWVNLFCRLSFSEILATCRKLQNLPNHPGSR